MARVAILYDGKTLAKWQKQAIETTQRRHEIVYLVAEGVSSASRRSLKHALYYLLNLFTIRKAQARVPHSHPCANPASCFHFVPAYEGAWARLSPEALAWLTQEKVDVIVKFGLNLLKVDPAAPPILSWHHGDPGHFRGRPAGFYELLQGKPFVGQIVQRLTNALDAGEVLAFAESRVHRHSYRKTLAEAYGLSPFLLLPALDALQEGSSLATPVTGRNYRLPSNGTVVRFVWQRFRALAARLAYGAFYEKHWRCSTTPVAGADDIAGLVSGIEGAAERWTTLPVPKGFRFIADPFFGRSADELLVEGYRASSGKGAILRYRGGDVTVLQADEPFHLSYPGSVMDGAERYVIPEMSRGGRQAAYRVDGGRLVKHGELDIDAGPLLDPTLMRHEGRVYLFANLSSEGAGILRLWSSDGLFGRFVEHPASPVRVSARGSRMAGSIAMAGGSLTRYGQDCRRSYGDGVLAFGIESLTERTYRERQIGEGAFTQANGPHTLNMHGDLATFDWYDDRLSLLAGVRRVMSRL